MRLRVSFLHPSHQIFLLCHRAVFDSSRLAPWFAAPLDFQRFVLGLVSEDTVLLGLQPNLALALRKLKLVPHKIVDLLSIPPRDPRVCAKSGLVCRGLRGQFDGALPVCGPTVGAFCELRFWTPPRGLEVVKFLRQTPELLSIVAAR